MRAGLSKHPASGFSLLEVLVCLTIGTMLLGNVFGSMLQTTEHYYNQQIRAKTDERARVLLDLMAFDIRLSGAGLPLGQKNFDISDPVLGQAALPVLLNAESGYIALRLNQRGLTAVLTADYTPSSTSLEFDVVSAAGFAAGDIIYLSNMTVAGKDGLRGEIERIEDRTIVLKADYAATAGCTFKSGSIMASVSTVVYDSGERIMRDDGGGPVPLLPKSAFQIEYLDEAGAAMALPLTAITVRNDLTSVRLKVSVVSERKLRHGDYYTGTAEQTIMLRNVVYGRL